MSNYSTNILIVDDTKANLISLEAILEGDNLKIITAYNGNDALKILLKRKIDIVLLDIQMPGMNGFEVAELMRANNKTKDIPIIFITAINKEEEHIFKGYELGAVDYLYKPISNEILKSKVKVFVKLNEQTKIIEEKTRALEEKIIQLEIVEKRLNHLVRIDELTGVLNRRAFEEIFNLKWERTIKSKEYFSALMIDIDNFKNFNDTYGHLKGDECLKDVAKVIEKTLKRVTDKVARLGGEEFVVLLPETDSKGAKIIAEEIRKNIEGLEILNKGIDTSDFVTVSIGVSSVVPTKFIEKREIIDYADKALYVAKKNGKNMTYLYR
ncbi:MAG: diguanylate cyclase [Psychrilyobacter sp.]|uniref:diguanylate cyclase n=1 Tax=Psychrilyobacter sp. TaxID=2586924 RepID=UPI003C7614F0